jgi:DNA-binding NtrC family response regulator
MAVSDVRGAFFLGQSLAVRKLRQVAARLGSAPFPILIQGETGCGKYELARFIHESSDRRSRPFVDVNCANLSSTLFESELFGSERGAYTDARERRQGRIAQAANGTLLFDEIDTLDLPLQAKLLRFVDRGVYERLGGSETIASEARLFFASNRDLRSVTAAGDFRQDLFARINWASLTIPPLRERRDDIAFLAGTFLEEARVSFKRSSLRWSPGALKVLSAFDWPDNVRELRSVTFVTAFLHDSDALISAAEVNETLASRASAMISADEPVSLSSVRSVAEKELIEDALRRAAGNRVRAATLLNIARRTLQHKIAKYGLS